MCKSVHGVCTGIKTNEVYGDVTHSFSSIAYIDGSFDIYHYTMLGLALCTAPLAMLSVCVSEEMGRATRRWSRRPC